MRKLLICNLLLFGSLCTLRGLEITSYIASGGNKRFTIIASCYGITIEDREKERKLSIMAPKWLAQAGHTTPLIEVSLDGSFFVVLSHNRAQSSKYALRHKSLKRGTLMTYSVSQKNIAQ